MGVGEHRLVTLAAIENSEGRFPLPSLSSETGRL
jgi:hypothetical protein